MEYKSTLSVIAIVLLIICLIGIATMLSVQKSNITWPPEINDCPDFWEKKPKSDGSGGNVCTNTRNIGDMNCSKEMDFDEIQEYQGESGKCQKYLWAKSCKVSWDGITNIGPICQEIASGKEST
jgi:hypothetical protein